MTTSTFANSVDPDQMLEEAIWSESTLFVIQFVNLNENIIWCNVTDSQKWVWLIKLFSRIRVKVSMVLETLGPSVSSCEMLTLLSGKK